MTLLILPSMVSSISNDFSVYSSPYYILQFQNLFVVSEFQSLGKVFFLLIDFELIKLPFWVSFQFVKFPHDRYFKFSLRSHSLHDFKYGFWSTVTFFWWYSVTMILHGAWWIVPLPIHLKLNDTLEVKSSLLPSFCFFYLCCFWLYLRVDFPAFNVFVRSVAPYPCCFLCLQGLCCLDSCQTPVITGIVGLPLCPGSLICKLYHGEGVSEGRDRIRQVPLHCLA